MLQIFEQKNANIIVAFNLLTRATATSTSSTAVMVMTSTFDDFDVTQHSHIGGCLGEKFMGCGELQQVYATSYRFKGLQVGNTQLI